jgi:archaellum component FlaF (FlaF/FlaG flagellin family)
MILCQEIQNAKRKSAPKLSIKEGNIVNRKTYVYNAAKNHVNVKRSNNGTNINSNS